MMKKAQVSHFYLPHIGGLELYVYRLNRDINKLKDNSIVLTTDCQTEKEGRREEAIYFKTNLSFMRNPFSFDLIKHFKENNYELMHLHSIWFLPCLEAVLFRKKARIITTLHGVYPDEASFFLKIFLNLYKPFAKYILNKSEKIIVLSNSEKDKLMKIFKTDSKKIVVIPNGIDIDKYKKTKKEPIILFTGRIIPDKNPDVLIKAAGILNKSMKNFKILFIGPIDEEYKKQLLSLAESDNIKDKISFLPSIPLEKREELMNYYRKSKVFISLGSWEGLPTRLMEAMQFEVPCITYSSGGSSELVKDNENGFVINELDKNLLAEKLNIILKDKKLANKLGRNARKTIMKGFNWEKISRKIQEVYVG